LGIYPKQDKSIYKTYNSILTVIKTLFSIAKPWNQPRCLTYGEWRKENVSMSFSGKWMELEIIMLSEISQPQKAKD
jgi:hypothetical protein